MLCRAASHRDSFWRCVRPESDEMPTASSVLKAPRKRPGASDYTPRQRPPQRAGTGRVCPGILDVAELVRIPTTCQSRGNSHEFRYETQTARNSGGTPTPPSGRAGRGLPLHRNRIDRLKIVQPGRIDNECGMLVLRLDRSATLPLRIEEPGPGASRQAHQPGRIDVPVIALSRVHHILPNQL